MKTIYYALRARRGIPLGGEEAARGAALFAPLPVVEDMCLVYAVPDGIAADGIGSYRIASEIGGGAHADGIGRDTAKTDGTGTRVAGGVGCTTADGKAGSGVGLTGGMVRTDALPLPPRTGRIVYAGKFDPKALPVGARVLDAGDVMLAPAAVNAHTHLQLAHMQGKMCWGQGFAAWLRQLIPLLAQPFDAQAIHNSVAVLVAAGTAHAADFTGAGLPLVAQALRTHGVGGTLLAEWFGFAPTEGAVWPLSARAAVQNMLADGTLPPPAHADAFVNGKGASNARHSAFRGAWVSPEVGAGTFASGGTASIGGGGISEAEGIPPNSANATNTVNAANAANASAETVAARPESATMLTAAPAGHALYSTAAGTMQATHAWCRAHGQPFSLHLAESSEEEQALAEGRGPLVDIYSARVLPPDWRAPGLRPVSFAARLGLLGAGTLAVHGVHCTPADIQMLATTGTALCLCPRSNAVLAVGQAPVAALAEAGVLLCLGTDGLTSNTDLDVWNEACALLDHLPGRALMRMLCINGWAALGMRGMQGWHCGDVPRWAFVPDGLAQSL